jgi:hypothetical protein
LDFHQENDIVLVFLFSGHINPVMRRRRSGKTIKTIVKKYVVLHLHLLLLCNDYSELSWRIGDENQEFSCCCRFQFKIRNRSWQNLDTCELRSSEFWSYNCFYECWNFLFIKNLVRLGCEAINSLEIKFIIRNIYI